MDPNTGYRFYAVDQLRPATTIRVLRAAGMSLESVEHVLQEPDSATDLLESHEQRIHAERTVQDQAIRIGQNMLADADQRPNVQTRHVGPTHWAAISTTIRVGDDTDHTDDWWIAIDPIDVADEVEVLLSWPVRRPVPQNFSLDGVKLRTGTLPERTEAFVRTEISEVDEDLLDKSAGGRLLHPMYLDFVEYLNRHGYQKQQMRQSTVLNEERMPVAMELAVTTDP